MVRLLMLAMLTWLTAAFVPSTPKIVTLKLNKSKPTTLYALELSEENIELVLQDARDTISTMFGNTIDNKAVGITGDVYLSSLDGPVVILGLKV